MIKSKLHNKVKIKKPSLTNNDITTAIQLINYLRIMSLLAPSLPPAPSPPRTIALPRFPLSRFLQLPLLLALSLSVARSISEVTLGKTIDEYSAWIQLDTSWGGAIELAILAKHYQMCVNAIDIKSGRVDRYCIEYGSKNRYICCTMEFITILYSQKSPQQI